MKLCGIIIVTFCNVLVVMTCDDNCVIILWLMKADWWWWQYYSVEIIVTVDDCGSDLRAWWPELMPVFQCDQWKPTEADQRLSQWCDTGLTWLCCVCGSTIEVLWYSVIVEAVHCVVFYLLMVFIIQLSCGPMQPQPASGLAVCVASLLGPASWLALLFWILLMFRDCCEIHCLIVTIVIVLIQWYWVEVGNFILHSIVDIDHCDGKFCWFSILVKAIFP